MNLLQTLVHLECQNGQESRTAGQFEVANDKIQEFHMRHPQTVRYWQRDR